MKIKQKHLAIAIWLVALVVVAGALLLFESDQLWKVQQKNLFLCSTLYLKEQLVVPGGLLTWVGTWFTQFLYYPWLGVLLLCCWWLGLMAIIKRAFRISDRWAILMLIPVAILLIANMDMGYWIYMLKLRGYFFVSTIGATIVAALLWGFRCVPDKHYLRTGYIFVACALGYPLFGIYGLASALLMGIWSWRLSASRTVAVVDSLVAILSVAAVPLFCYRYVYYQVNLSNVLWAELPLFYITEEHSTYYIPYYLLALFFVILAVTYSANREGGKPMNKFYYLACHLVIAVLLVGGVYHFWMKDENFHRELAMQHRISNQDWMGVIEEAAEQQDEPTRAIVMMRNMALSRLGKQGEAMCLYKNGSKAYAAPFGMRLMLVAGPLIYYQYGMLNYCNRLCMEMGVEFGWRVEHIKLLARCAVLNKEQAVARKYINILKKTMFHKDWAVKTESMLNNPKLIAQDKETEPITHMLHFTDELNSDNGYVERYVMRQLVNYSYSKDPIFQEQSLLASLWFRDSKIFWYHFNVYTSLHPNGPIPVAYQEAAYLYGKVEGRPDLDKMPFNAGVKDSFEKFFQVFGQYEGMKAEDIRKQTGLPYSNTFYYNYYIMANLPEY